MNMKWKNLRYDLLWDYKNNSYFAEGISALEVELSIEFITTLYINFRHIINFEAGRVESVQI